MASPIRSLNLPALLQRIAEHEACRPAMPRGLSADDPVFIEWYQAFTGWCATKDRLECARNVRGQDFTVKKKPWRSEADKGDAA